MSGPGQRTKISNPFIRGYSGFRGKGRGRGNAIHTDRARPTHFLALPLKNHPSLMAQINTFQKGLFNNVDGLDKAFPSQSTSAGNKSTVQSSLVRGLDSSILIDPRRMHMTLGVMALEQDDGPVIPSSTTMPTTSAAHWRSSNNPPLAQSLSSVPFKTKKTVSTALSLLNSLKPRISEILDGDKGVKVPLEIMHVLKTEKMSVKERKRAGDQDDPELTNNEDVGAGVLYVAPETEHESLNMDLHKLIQVCGLVHQTFKDAGYLTDTRPLKLHCTILNTSHRRPSSRQPFAYSDILASDALRRLCGNTGDSISFPSTSTRQPNTSSSSSNPSFKSQGHSVMKNPPSVSVNFGVFPVEEIQLWVMGSHGPNNEYVNCGGVLLE